MDQNPKSEGAWPASIFAITLFQEDLAAACRLIQRDVKESEPAAAPDAACRRLSPR
ncbi:MAG: hypothetical protein HGA86_03010 [Anaerolineaceae bacterium]|nr:hypothetical protein [Anaerolineaceae bacterium]